MKRQKKEILTRQESLHASRRDVFYFLRTAHILIQLPTHILHNVKAPHANDETKALIGIVILSTHKIFVSLLTL